MRQDLEKDFDLQIRSMLSEAREEVPERVWSAVSERIGSPKAAPVPWWRWAVGVACAAALASVVVFSGISGSPEAVAPAPVAIAEVAEAAESSQEQIPSEEPVAGTLTACAEPVEVSYKNVAASAEQRSGDDAQVAECPDAAPAAPAVIAEDNVSAPQSEEGVETKEEPIMKETKPSEDPFARMAFEDKTRKVAFLTPSSIDFRGKVGTNDGLGMSSVPAGMRGASGSSSSPKTGVSESSESVYSIPVTFGVGIKFPLSERLYLGTGIDYSTLSRKFEGVYTQVDENGKVEQTLKGDVAHNVRYIGIPVNLYYSLLNSNLLDFYVFGGAEIEKCIANRYRISDAGTDVLFKDSTKGVQMSLGLGMGVAIKISDLLSVYADPSARYYFDCSQPVTIRTQQPLMFGLDLGLRFNL